MIFPPKCICCRELLERQERYVCRACFAELPYLREPVCLKCGKEIEDEEKEYCYDCENRPRSYIKGFPLFRYRGGIKESLYRFKYEGKKSYGKYYATEIVKKYGRIFNDLGINILVPVPVHKSRLKKRGYNQAGVLCEEIGKILDIPMNNHILIRQHNTAPQKKLDNVEREKNLFNAFIPESKIVQYKSALIVDDIYTTGATVEACTRALHETGIEDVYYTSVCIGKGN